MQIFYENQHYYLYQVEKYPYTFGKTITKITEVRKTPKRASELKFDEQWLTDKLSINQVGTRYCDRYLLRQQGRSNLYFK